MQLLSPVFDPFTYKTFLRAVLLHIFEKFFKKFSRYRAALHFPPHSSAKKRAG